MSFWKVSTNAPIYEGQLLAIFSRLAEHTVGYMDWNPYIPAIMTRVMRGFDLPVYYKQIPPAKKYTIGKYYLSEILSK